MKVINSSIQQTSANMKAIEAFSTEQIHITWPKKRQKSVNKNINPGFNILFHRLIYFKA
jgi:hypothetical protein